MAGFLDKNNRIIDMTLTSYGKELLSKGELQFVYWVAFDDEVDYDPYIAESGSLDSDSLEDAKLRAIEDTLVREATTGYRHLNRNGSDHTNVYRPLFDMPQGQIVLPVISCSTDSHLTIDVKQRKVSELHVKRDSRGAVLEQIGPFDRGFERFDSSTKSVEYCYTQNSFPPDAKLNGFLVRVFESGSDGMIEVDERRDMQNNLSFNNDLILIPIDPSRK